MKTLIFLLLSLQCAAQSLTFHEGAGTNPKHLESLGRESGWVEVWVGPMAFDGQVLKIYFDYWKEIESVELKVYGFDKVQFGTVEMNTKTPADAWVGVATLAKPAGFGIKVKYTVNFKKA